MFHHLALCQKNGLNKHQYCTKVDLSYQAFCKFCSRQNEPSDFILIKTKNDEGVLSFIYLMVVIFKPCRLLYAAFTKVNKLVLSLSVHQRYYLF
jgi:hypothetical protein